MYCESNYFKDYKFNNKLGTKPVNNFPHSGHNYVLYIIIQLCKVIVYHYQYKKDHIINHMISLTVIFYDQCHKKSISFLTTNGIRNNRHLPPQGQMLASPSQ